MSPFSPVDGHRHVPPVVAVFFDLQKTNSETDNPLKDLPVDGFEGYDPGKSDLRYAEVEERMRTVLGVSVGSATARATALDFADDSVCSASVARSFDASDQVSAALELLRSMSAVQNVDPADAVLAVPDDPAGRGRNSAYSIHRSERFGVVSELGAQLRFLRGSGQLDGLRTVAVCDIGASGTTVSIADPVTGRVYCSQRTTAFGGNVCDEAVRNYLLSTYGADELISSTALDSVTVAVGYAREQLSSLRVAEVPGPFVGGPVRLWRSSFDDIVERSVRLVEDWTASVIVEAPHAVNGLVMVGGCAHLPLLRRMFRRDLRLPVIVPSMPESLTAHGAALLASDDARSRSKRSLVAVKTITPAHVFENSSYEPVPRHRSA